MTGCYARMRCAVLRLRARYRVVWRRNIRARYASHRDRFARRVRAGGVTGRGSSRAYACRSAARSARLQEGMRSPRHACSPRACRICCAEVALRMRYVRCIMSRIRAYCGVVRRHVAQSHAAARSYEGEEGFKKMLDWCCIRCGVRLTARYAPYDNDDTV